MCFVLSISLSCYTVSNASRCNSRNWNFLSRCACTDLTNHTDSMASMFEKSLEFMIGSKKWVMWNSWHWGRKIGGGVVIHWSYWTYLYILQKFMVKNSSHAEDAWIASTVNGGKYYIFPRDMETWVLLLHEAVSLIVTIQT